MCNSALNTYAMVSGILSTLSGKYLCLTIWWVPIPGMGIGLPGSDSRLFEDAIWKHITDTKHIFIIHIFQDLKNKINSINKYNPLTF